MVVPKTCCEGVLFKYHDSEISGQPGGDETLRAIQERFRWDGIRNDVREYVRTCLLSSCCKSTRTSAKEKQITRQPQPHWETVAVDLMGHYPRSRRGKRILLVVTDLFSRWVEAFPLGTSSAWKIVQNIEDEASVRFGYLKAILKDNGSQFMRKQWYGACPSSALKTGQRLSITPEKILLKEDIRN